VPDSPNPLLQAVLRAAIDATGATQGWLLATTGDELVVRAAVGADGQILGARVPLHSGFAGYVASSGQPLAMSPRRDDERGAEGVAALVGTRPQSVLAVPCGTDDSVHGVLELVEKVGGGPFSFDDVELATLIAGIAGAALASDAATGSEAPSPRELGDNLVHLASADPARYATLATFLAAVLNDG
jgi:GAF domain-containing protein